MNTFKVYKEGSKIRKVEIIGDGVDENDPVLKALLSVVRAKGDRVLFVDFEQVKAER
jgi:hypothetical protein